MARAYGIKPETLGTRLRKGLDVKNALSRENYAKNKKRVKDHEGKEYASVTAMAEAYGLSLSTFRQRLKYGWDLKKTLTTKAGRRPVRDHLGNEYASTRAMAETYGMSRKTLRKRLEDGWSLERALTETAIKPGNMYPETKVTDVFGREFASLRALKIFYGIMGDAGPKLTKENVKTDVLISRVKSRFDGAKIGDFKTYLVSWPYYEISDGQHAYMIHIDKLLGMYRECRAKARGKEEKEMQAS